MADQDIVSSIMAKLRELHPELPDHARVNLEMDLRQMLQRHPLRQKKTREGDRQQQHFERRRRARTNRHEGAPLGFAELIKGLISR